MNNPNPIVWTAKTFALSDLKPYENNPRRITETAYDNLKKSLQQDGYHQRLIATEDGLIIGGHQRLRALKELGFTKAEVLIPNRALTDVEIDRINIRDNLLFGDFDWDILANRFDPDQLLEWGMPDSWLPDTKGKGAEDDKEPEAKKPCVCPNCGHVLGSE